MAAEGDAEAAHLTAEIPEWKRREVDAIADLVAAHDTVGVVGVAGIPSRQLQEMRAALHGRGQLRMGRNTLLRRGLEAADEGVETLVDDVTGQVGIVVSDENPFTLFKTLEETKTAAPINAGEVAPNDIVIEEGDTGIDPGPFVGELQQVGADARIQEGSIQVLSDSTVAVAGDEVSQQLANVLSELGIEPKEVGLDLRAVFADGVEFSPDELAIDVDEYRADVQSAAARAHQLSVGAAYPTAQTAGALLAKASTDARAVGIAGAIESPDLADDLVARADSQLRALAAHIDDEEALPEELRGTPEAAESAEAAEEAEAEESAEAAEEAEAEESTEDAEETQEETADAEPDGAGDDDDDDGGDAGAGMGDLFG
ncbi:MAG: 50S ribosomal protein L10 [Halobacteriaceae archaeon]